MTTRAPPTGIERFLLGETPGWFLIEVGARTIVVFLVLIVALRFFGKRMAGQLTIVEMGVMILLGGLVSPAMQFADRGVRELADRLPTTPDRFACGSCGHVAAGAIARDAHRCERCGHVDWRPATAP